MDIQVREPMSHSEKLVRPRVSENIKKIKERIIQTNQLLDLFKTKEKGSLFLYNQLKCMTRFLLLNYLILIPSELVQHKECIKALEQKLAKSKVQVDTLNKENGIFQQAAQQFRSEVEQLKKELAHKNDIITEHAALKNDLKKLQSENDRLGKKINSLEVMAFFLIKFKINR